MNGHDYIRYFKQSNPTIFKSLSKSFLYGNGQIFKEYYCSKCKCFAYTYKLDNYATYWDYYTASSQQITCEEMIIKTLLE